MKSSELKELLEAIKKQDKSSVNGKVILENIMKIFTSLTFAGVIWVVSSTISIRERIIKMEVELSNVKEVTNEPRFSQSDFQKEMVPILQIVNRNSNLLDERSDWMVKKSEAITSLTNEFSNLKRELEEIKNKL